MIGTDPPGRRRGRGRAHVIVLAFASGAACLIASTAAAQQTHPPGAQPPYPPQAHPAPTAQPNPAPPYAPPAPPSPSAGGLTAPGPLPEEQRGNPSGTEALLDESRDKDSGRGLTWFWFNVEGGFQHVGLETFDVDESNLTASLVPTEASGGYVGAGLGVQLLFLRLGPRGRIGFFPDWQLFTIGGELGAQFPLGILEPFVNIGAGYATLGNLSDELAPLAETTNVRGYYARLGAGLDVYLGDVFSIGAQASWELLGLSRTGVTPADLSAAGGDLTSARGQALVADGSGLGSAVSVGARVGVSF